MKILYSTALVALLSLFLADVSPLAAQTTADTKAAKIPFHGKLQAVDTSAQTITISGKTPRVFHLTTATKITDGNKNPTTLASAVVGEDVGGSYTKDASGTMTLYSVRLGAKGGTKAAASTTPSPVPAAATTTPTPAPAPAAAPAVAPSTSAPAKTSAEAPATASAPAKAKKVRFSGKVVSVDATAKTLVVHGKADQTFTVTDDTKFTGATDLSGVTVGAKVSGSYTKSTDGTTLNVATLKVGK